MTTLSSGIPFDRLPQAADPTMAARNLERWREGVASLPASSLPSPLLEAVFGNSPYLSRILLREPAFAARLGEVGFAPAFADLLAEVQTRLGAETDLARLMAGLRRAKQQAALLIALADISGAWALEDVTGAVSDFAETALRVAVRFLLNQLVKSGTLIVPDPTQPEQGSGLVVLGMGKFGARELNYSSDIDLIVFYDDGIARTRDPDRLSQTFIRLTRDLVKIMDERTADGYVFRTDLRLRPDPGATPPAVSLSAAEVYYASVGQNWERAAMIKARAVAGDAQAADEVAAMLKPFIWRRNLDFAAIQDIHSIKRQINAHKGHKKPQVNGHDVKVGRGGIREIEFFAQTQQLIHGGRDGRLRGRGTCETLMALVGTGHLAPEVARDMILSYDYLRRVEHRLQMIEDRQTHQIPKSDAEVAAVATFLGYDDPALFREELLGHLLQVEGHYAHLFEDSPSLTSSIGSLVFTGTEDDPETVETLRGLGFGNPSGVISTVGNWHRGRYRCMRSSRARELLTELTPRLLELVAATPHPDDALNHLDGFLGRLPAGVQIFSLFAASPRLLAVLAQVMGTAPRLAQILGGHAGLLESVIAPDFFDPLPGRDTLVQSYARAVAEARDFEDALLLMRRWTHEQMFRAGVHLLQHLTPGDGCGPFLSAVAEIALADLLPRVEQDFARRYGWFPGGSVGIIAMGKLGSGQMTIGSDLDLILIYDTPPDAVGSDGAKSLSPAEYYSRLTQRLISVLTARSREGALYEVDMRLRPSGNAGPVAVSLRAFAHYQEHDAWTWEHMALTRARMVGGSAALRSQVTAIVHKALTKPRDAARLVWEVADMRRRIDSEFGSTNPWDVKYARGGFIDNNFIAQYLMLRHGGSHPEILRVSTVEALGRMAEAGLLDAEVAAELTATHRLCRRVQSLLRLTTGGDFAPATASGALKNALARVVLGDGTGASLPENPGGEALDFAAADLKLRSALARGYKHFRALIEDPAARVADSSRSFHAPDPTP